MAFQRPVEKTSCNPPLKKTLAITSKQITLHSNVKPISNIHYYKLLGLSPNASPQEIKTAYYKLARKLHPDASKEKSTRFQEISNAYRVLSNNSKNVENNNNQQENNKVLQTATAALKGIKVNGMKKKETPTIANDKICLIKSDNSKFAILETEVNVTFLQAILGTKKQCNIRYLRKCPKCIGMSMQLDESRQIIPTKKSQMNINGGENVGELEYDATKGNQIFCKHKCTTCDNRGFITDVIKLTVIVPPNSNAGDVISVRNPVNNHKINVRLDIAKSDYFRRLGNDVYTDKYIKISEAVLGGKFTVRGLYEQLSFELGPAIESHTIVTLNGKGIRSRNGTGKHIVTMKIRIPQSLSARQRQLILALARIEDSILEKDEKTTI